METICFPVPVSYLEFIASIHNAKEKLLLEKKLPQPWDGLTKKIPQTKKKLSALTQRTIL